MRSRHQHASVAPPHQSRRISHESRVSRRLSSSVYCRAPRAMMLFVGTFSQRTPRESSQGMRSSQLVSTLRPAVFPPRITRAMAFEQCGDFRMFWLSGKAQRQRDVVHTDVDDVDARDRGDLVDTVYRGGGLDHDDHDLAGM